VDDRDLRSKRGGRPKKFQGPSSVVTLTLPKATIDQLSGIHQDRAKAIVKAAQLAAPAAPDDETRVDLIEVGPNVAMIAVPYCKYLAQSPEISLVHVLPNRFLILLSAGTPLSSIEIYVEDQLELLAEDKAKDRQILSNLLEKLRKARRANRASLAAVVLVKTN
jgi:hypothetical protein